MTTPLSNSFHASGSFSIRYRKWSISTCSCHSSGGLISILLRTILIESREEDVSTTMYKETIAKNPSQDDSDPQRQRADDARVSKVNRICDAFLGALKYRTSTHFQNVVTAHVCKTPPDLDAGLSQIAGLRSELISVQTMTYCVLT
jgi:hypothetical protein